MNLLLDTHVALWAITDSPRLSRKARDVILSPKTIAWVSEASIWEIAIKHALGRGDMPISSKNAVRYFRESGYRFLLIEVEHAAAVEGLPLHHQDPFDHGSRASLAIHGEVKRDKAMHGAEGTPDLWRGSPAVYGGETHRILVAQALVKPMRLMTHDPLLVRYDDTVILI